MMIDKETSIKLTKSELEDLLEEAAERGAHKAVESFKTNITMWAGEGVFNVLIYIMGSAALAGYLYFQSKQ